MDQRRNFIIEWRSGTIDRSTLCRLFGISRQTGYKWIRRFERTKRLDAVQELSRRPLHSPSATPKKLVRLILSQRRQFPTWGPVPIRKRLQTHWPQHKWPATSTIGDILKRNGLVPERRRRLRLAPQTRPFARCHEPNDLWCIDFKGHFKMGDGRVCYPLTVMDGASRFLLACVGFHSPTLENVRPVFVELFRAFGLPKAIRSDNGEPFAAISAAGGLSQLAVWFTKLGIRVERIDPGKPQQNARHERMHLTLKQHTCSPPRHSLGWQQRAFDKFRRIYNHVRPHRALGLATPASLYVPSERRMPEELPPLFYPFSDCHRVRSDGTIRWRQRKLFISSSLAGEIVGLNTLNTRYIQVAFANVMLGFIDSYQPERGLIRSVPQTKKTRVSAMSPV